MLAKVLSLIVSGYSNLVSDKVGGMAGRLFRDPKASWSQEEMLSGDLKAMVAVGTRNPHI